MKDNRCHLILMWVVTVVVLSCCIFSAVEGLALRAIPRIGVARALSFGDSEGDVGRALEGCVCLVTGASRGIGKGIALELGRQGAIVYVTGTSSKRSGFGDGSVVGIYPGTIEETAEEVTRLGGKGVALRCDHRSDADVQAVFERISADTGGRLDVLVNNAFQTPAQRMEFLTRRFWEPGCEETWDCIHTVGLRSHYVASAYAMPLMFSSASAEERRIPRPIVFMISSFGGIAYSFNTAYGVGKAALDRLARDMFLELQDANKDVAVVSLWPGVVQTEITDVHVGTGDWDKYVKIPRIEANFESPRFTGRAVVALALDPENIRYAGSYQVVAELASKYNFTDINGNRPPSIRSLRFLLTTYAMDESLRSKIPSSLIPDWKLPFWVMSQGGKAPSPKQTTQS